MATPNPLQVPDLNYYEVLGVEVTATSEEVKKAFKKQALYVHPDKASDAAKDAWLKLSKAYEVLSNQEKRADYDRLLRKEKGKVSSCATGSLLQLCDGPKLSSAFPMWYQQWVSAGKAVKMGQFPASLVSDLKKFMNGPLQETHLSGSALPISCNVQKHVDPSTVARGKRVPTQDHTHDVKQDQQKESSDDAHGFTYDQMVSTISGTVDDSDSSETLSAEQKI